MSQIYDNHTNLYFLVSYQWNLIKKKIFLFQWNLIKKKIFLGHLIWFRKDTQTFFSKMDIVRHLTLVDTVSRPSFQIAV